jgi:hypothetical protein
MTEKPRDLSAPEGSDGPLRSFEELGAALGRDCAKPGLIDRRLDEVSRTKQRFDRQDRERPFTSTALGRAFFARYDILQKLAAYIEGTMRRNPRQRRQSPRGRSAGLSVLPISRRWHWWLLTP